MNPRNQKDQGKQRSQTEQNSSNLPDHSGCPGQGCVQLNYQNRNNLEVIQQSLRHVSPQSRLFPMFALGKKSWFKTGGPASLFVQPYSVDDVVNIVRWVSSNLSTKVYVLGGLSNVLIRDKGISGIVLNLNLLSSCHHAGQGHFVFDAGVTGAQAFQCTWQAGYTGLEFLSCIPGTLGGAIFMNAGANGHEIGDFLDWIEIITGLECNHTQIKRIDRKDLNMQYRNGGLSPNTIIIRAGLSLVPGDKKEIWEKSQSFLQERLRKFPLSPTIGTAGSTFKNPPGQDPAWKLIDQAGCRGMKLGGAMISDKHANFLINTGSATAWELETLGERIRKIVFEHSGVLLEWEVKRIGDI